MKNFVSHIISNLRILYLISILAATVALILIMFPDDYQRVQYDYAIGSFCSLSLYADGLLKFIIFVALYAAWSVLFHPVAYQYFCLAAQPLVKKIKRKKNKAKKN